MPQAKKVDPKKAPADPTAPKEVGKPLTPPTQLLKLRFSPDGKVLAAGAFDGTVKRWDTSAAEPADLPPVAGFNGWVGAVAFAGNTLVAGDSWGFLAAFDAAGKKLWAVPAAHDGWLRMVAASPDGATVATCGRDEAVRLWSAKDGKKLAEIKAGTDTLAVCFSPDGKQVLAGDLFGVVRVFDIATGKVARTIEAKELHKVDRIQDVGGVRNLAFDAAGKTLFIAGAEPKTGGFVQCTPLLFAHDWASGKRTSTWKGANDNEGYITDVVWHPDGYLMGTCSGQPGQGKLFCWKPGEAQPFFVSPRANAHSVALHPNGDRLATSATNANSSGNGRVKGKDGDYPANVSPVQMWQVPRRGGFTSRFRSWGSSSPVRQSN